MVGIAKWRSCSLAGGRISLARRSFGYSSRIRSEFSHIVVGGGVVGTAIAAELQSVDGNSVLLIEQHSGLGTETTSRNSEVIHAGLYYPTNSLKARLCIEGKNKIYDAWDRGNFQVNLQKCGKWVVAQDESEQEYLEKLQENALSLDVPVRMVSAKESQSTYPLIGSKAGALESPTTGIISAHDLLTFFEARFESSGGIVGLNTILENVTFNRGTSNYILSLKEKDSKENFELTSDNLVNAAGLHAQRVANMLLPMERHYESHFAKGLYYGYQPVSPTPGSRIAGKLIYPCPNANASSLGVHLTFDLGGQIRFGPDLQWLDTSNAYDLDYSVNEDKLDEAFNAVSRYFPSIKKEELVPQYSGVRPKLLSSSENKKKFADFVIEEEEEFPGFVNLVGIESPGLTASWAIAEYVKHIYHQ